MEIYPLTKYKEKVVNDLVHVVQLKFMEIYSYEEKEKVMNGCPCSYNSKLFYATIVIQCKISCGYVHCHLVAISELSNLWLSFVNSFVEVLAYCILP